MAKNCLIYETLNGVSKMTTSRNDEGLMTLSGVFGVCGVRNNNQRVYETSNYSKMINEMKDRIKENGGIPGELEHPQSMNVTLENVSHKITDINIDENGVVTGSITLLNTPKGQIAQAIVEGGLPLFISSRATGNVDKVGNVCLEKISTYDLVGTPGFSQARLKLNENQVVESINESSIYYIAEKEEEKEEEAATIEENNENDDMELNELLKKFEALETRVAELEGTNEELREALEEAQSNRFDEERFANGIQNWIVEEFAPEVEKWITEEYAPSLQDEINTNISESIEDAKEDIVESVNDNFVNEITPKIESWVVEEYSNEVEKWCTEHLAAGIQNWIVEEFAPEVENWMNESYMDKVQNAINESVATTKKSNLDAIDETLKVLESIEVSKPTYSRKAVITENFDEPRYIQEMPADKRVQWDMASKEVKESIQRRAKLYNFVTEGAIEKFWESIDFETVKPSKTIYEGLENVMDERERSIRAAFRKRRMF